MNTVRFLLLAVAVTLLVPIGCSRAPDTDSKKASGEPTPRNAVSADEFMKQYNEYMKSFTEEGDTDNANVAEALRLLGKQSPEGVKQLKEATHDPNMIVRNRTSLALEMVAPDLDAPWRRILQDGKVFTADRMEELTLMYTVFLYYGEITPYVDNVHTIGFEGPEKATITLKQLVSMYGEPDEIGTVKDGRTLYYYGPIGLVISEDGKEIDSNHASMSDAFWAMLYKSVKGKYPEELKVTGLPDLQITLPTK